MLLSRRLALPSSARRWLKLVLARTQPQIAFWRHSVLEDHRAATPFFKMKRSREVAEVAQRFFFSKKRFKVFTSGSSEQVYIGLAPGQRMRRALAGDTATFRERDRRLPLVSMRNSDVVV